MSRNGEAKSHREFWNAYVDEDFPQRKVASGGSLELPGDEWMPREFWDKFVPEVLLARVPAGDPVFVEIGAGAGKQTKIVLEHKPGANIYTFDISASFISALKEYLADDVGKRVKPTLLGDDQRDILRRLDRDGLVGGVDAVYAFDAMVHVDLQALVVYFISAVFALKDDGVLVMDVANAESELGFRKLLMDAKTYYPSHGAPCSKFMFSSPSLIGGVLGKLGFDVEFLTDLRGHALFAARLTDRAKGLEALKPVAEDWEL